MGNRVGLATCAEHLARIKQKLSLKNHSRLDLAKKKLSVAGGPSGSAGGSSSSQQEADVEKAKLLFGDIHLPASKKK